MPILIYHHPNTPVNVTLLKSAFATLLQYARLNRAQVELSLIGAKRMQSLNHHWRKKNKPTDVLSFPQELKPSLKKVPWILGEILIATPVAIRQAKQSKVSLTEQVLRLAVHGLVHLQGWDHEKGGQEEKRFFQLEKKYLIYLEKKGFQFNNDSPYLI